MIVVYGIKEKLNDKAGNYCEKKLGRKTNNGESFQQVVEAGDWFCASVPSGGYALVGCTVAPGFDFEMPSRDELLALFPQHQGVIKQMPR